MRTEQASDLSGSLPAAVVQGGASIVVPLTIFRIGGSIGDIGFTLSPLPGEVTGFVFPNPASGNSVALTLQAAIGPVPETRMVVITGAPLSPSVGPAPRNFSIILSTVPELRVSGPADIDFAGAIIGLSATPA